ncbi:DUF6879 family protein [Nocardiopsis alborubida]|uniref:DUF6879 domain-containing protein n=1 Tax=Nocardiopsis alborubida TaxID=146802 RepID=A0A7X6RP29_9ACTN|nr:DUF6879 family protein [Nocardiopsis alborubida]NKY96757.1 hypothetical protein [Nocardiopsis alborubida]
MYDVPSPYSILLARARLLLTPAGEYLTPGAAELLTGRASGSLINAAKRGDLLAEQRRPGAHRRYPTKEILAYMADRGIPATALDAVHYAAASGRGQRLDEQEFLVDEAYTRQRSPGVCWHLEARKRLSDPDDLALSTWHRGDRMRAVNCLVEEGDRLTAQRQAHLSQGVDVRTVWATHIPLDHHRAYLAHAFRVRERAGFSVRVVDLTSDGRPVLEHAHPVPSLIAYPGRVLYLLRHTEQGRPAGAIRLDDAHLATAVGDLLTHLSAHGQSADGFARLRL